MNQQEFDALASEGYTDIPVVHEILGDLDIGEGLSAVLGWISLAEAVEVGAVDYKDSHWVSAEARARGWAFS